MKLSLVEVMCAFILAALLCSLGGCDVAPATAAAAPPDISGTWRGTLTMQDGPMDIVMTLDQSGQFIEGAAQLPGVVWSPCTNPFTPEAHLAGAIDVDGRLSLTFYWENVGQVWTVSADIAGDAIDGTIVEAPEYTLNIRRGQ